MKKLFFFICLLSPFFVSAQALGSLNVFSENADKFYLILDGKRQNAAAHSNIRIEELPDLFYSVKIIFEDSSLAPISKNNLYVSDADDILRDATYRIHNEKGSKAKLAFYSMLPAKENFVAGADMYVFHFGKPDVFETMPVAERNEFVPAESETTTPILPGSLNIFSLNKDKFFLYLDGTRQNETAQSNVRIEGVPGLYYNVKIIFKEPGISPIIKNNLLISDADNKLMDASYRIRRDKTGKPRLNFYSMTAVNAKFSAPAGMYVREFEKISKAMVAVSLTPAKISPVKGTISNVKVTIPPSSREKSTARPAIKIDEISKQAPPSVVESNKTIITGKEAEIAKTAPESNKCNGWPMGKGDLVAAKKRIEDVTNEAEKLSTAKEIIATNCLLVNQVTEFCNLFKSEKSKLAFAKYAYKFTIDRKNYSEVNKALSLEISRKELNKFINGG
ncbi:MAG: DUF4476 domain-containing protein [Ferruginibacter sp.]